MTRDASHSSSHAQHERRKLFFRRQTLTLSLSFASFEGKRMRFLLLLCRCRRLLLHNQQQQTHTAPADARVRRSATTAGASGRQQRLSPKESDWTRVRGSRERKCLRRRCFLFRVACLLLLWSSRVASDGQPRRLDTRKCLVWSVCVCFSLSS